MKKESNGIGENKNSKKISKNNKIISSILAVVVCSVFFVGLSASAADDKNDKEVVIEEIEENDNSKKSCFGDKSVICASSVLGGVTLTALSALFLDRLGFINLSVPKDQKCKEKHIESPKQKNDTQENIERFCHVLEQILPEDLFQQFRKEAIGEDFLEKVFESLENLNQRKMEKRDKKSNSLKAELQNKNRESESEIELLKKEIDHSEKKINSLKAELQNKNRESESEIELLKKEIDCLGKEIKLLKAELQNKNRESESEIELLKKEIDCLGKEIKLLKAELQNKNREIDCLEKEINSSKSLFT